MSYSDPLIKLFAYCSNAKNWMSCGAGTSEGPSNNFLSKELDLFLESQFRGEPGMKRLKKAFLFETESWRRGLQES